MEKTSSYTFVLLVTLAVAAAQTAYYGKLISSSWGDSSYSGLSGSVYAVDDQSFQITNFKLDDQAGNAVFHMGTDKSFSDAKTLAGEDPTAQLISNPLGTGEVLGSYDGTSTVVFSLKGVLLSNVRYLAVFSRDQNEYLGGMDLPANFKVPAPANIGKFRERAHDVSSGDVIVLNDRTIQINNLRYDGQGPDAFFYVGVTDQVVPQTAPYGKIPDENGIIDEKATAYADRDIILTLPENISARGLKWLSIYCIEYSHNFGEVTFPAELNVPPFMGTDLRTSSVNCEPLSDNLQVSWVVKDDSITFELAGNIDQTTDYMAFGLSGSDTGFRMADADVVVADWTDAEPRAVDYKLTGYSQCASNGGACPDEDPSNAGTNNAIMPSAEVVNGIVRVQYTRALATGDANDKNYRTDGTAQQIVWAVGPINTKKEAAKHYGVGDGGRISSSVAIDFGREAKDNCPLFKRQDVKEKPKFQAHHIYGDEVDSFTFEIGQSASEQGYKAITGNPSWGIAWYVNGILVPELHLKRGVEYTFRVGGGVNATEASMYHPLYITTDENGGLQEKQSSTETVFPGTVNGASAEFAVGGYCEWKLTQEAVKKVDDGKVYECYSQFKDDLVLECMPNSPGYTEFKWTPTADMPKELFYQCYTHENLGWKINLYDEFPAEREASPDDSACQPSSGTSLTVISFLTLVSVLLLNLI